jgi:hypothetical protein
MIRLPQSRLVRCVYLGVGAALSLSLAAASSASPEPVFVDVGAPLPEPLDKTTGSCREATLHADALPDSAATPPHNLIVEFAPESRKTLVLTNRDRSEGLTAVWRGHVEEQAESKVRFTATGTSVEVTVDLAGFGRWTIQARGPSEAGLYALCQWDAEKLRQLSNAKTPPIPSRRDAATAVLAPSPAGGPSAKPDGPSSRSSPEGAN